MGVYWVLLLASSLVTAGCVVTLVRRPFSAASAWALGTAAVAAFVGGLALTWPLHGAQLGVWLENVLPLSRGASRDVSVNGLVLVAVVAWAAVLLGATAIVAVWWPGESHVDAQLQAGRLVSSSHHGSRPVSPLAPPRRGEMRRHLKLVHSAPTPAPSPASQSTTAMGAATHSGTNPSQPVS